MATDEVVVDAGAVVGVVLVAELDEVVEEASDELPQAVSPRAATVRVAATQVRRRGMGGVPFG
ncbi:MAG: hypothetical protein ACLP2J_01780 [Acidimicrobiales bacterium]|jgi:hypothetical protein